MRPVCCCEGCSQQLRDTGEEMWTGTTGADAQAHTGQSLILHFVFPSAGCSYSVSSFTSSFSFFFFFSSCFPVFIFPDLIRLFLFLCPLHVFPSPSLFSSLLFFSYSFYTSNYKDFYAGKDYLTTTSYLFSKSKLHSFA